MFSTPRGVWGRIAESPAATADGVGRSGIRINPDIWQHLDLTNQNGQRSGEPWLSKSSLCPRTPLRHEPDRIRETRGLARETAPAKANNKHLILGQLIELLRAYVQTCVMEVSRDAWLPRLMRFCQPPHRTRTWPS